MDNASTVADRLSHHGFRRFMMSRTKVGHLKLVGHIDGRQIDIVVDTGAAKTIVDVNYCRSEGIAEDDIEPHGDGAGGVTISDIPLHDVPFTLEEMPVRSDGLFAIDLSKTNQMLAMKGAEPIIAVLGQDVLRNHQAVIDYAILALFLKEQPAAESGSDYTSELAELLSHNGFRRFAMSRTKVGHLELGAHLDGKAIDIVLDTGATNTIVDLSYCRSEGIAVSDTGQLGSGVRGAAVSVHTLGDIQLTLEGLPVRCNGILAIDMSDTNERRKMKGIDPIRAVLGQDVLRNHQAVIDYATLSLFLKKEPA